MANRLNFTLTAYAGEQLTALGSSKSFTPANLVDSVSQSNAVMARVTIETQPVRTREDSTAPTSTIGTLRPVGTTFEVWGIDNLRNFRIIETTASATAFVQYYR